MPLNAPWMEYVFALHLRQMLRNEAVTLQERAAGRGERATQAIAFADLVGFTELGETVDVGGARRRGGAAAAAGRRAGRPAGAARQGDRRRGDAGRAASPRSWSRRRSSWSSARRRPTEFPPLRAGVAFGPAANHFGDWFGSTVNLASRLTARAGPDSVLATEEVREAVGEDGYKWSSAGPKKLKGFTEPVKTFRVRRDDDAG